MQEVFRAIGRLSQSNATVLITGESGHREGARRARAPPPQPARRMPFIAITTAAIPKDLLERSCSGHERSDLRSPARRACADLAGRGQDAVPSTRSATCRRPAGFPPLRVLVDGEYYRVGGRNAPLRQRARGSRRRTRTSRRVRRGLFREDLLHRLQRSSPAPAAAARRPGWPMAHFNQKSARATFGRAQGALRRGAEGAHASFPGNVRQLRTSATGSP